MVVPLTAQGTQVGQRSGIPPWPEVPVGLCRRQLGPGGDGAEGADSEADTSWEVM